MVNHTYIKIKIDDIHNDHKCMASHPTTESKQVHIIRVMKLTRRAHEAKNNISSDPLNQCTTTPPHHHYVVYSLEDDYHYLPS